MSNKKLKYISSSKTDSKDKNFEVSDGKNNRNRRNRISTASKIGIWFFAILSISVLSFAVFTLFSGAKIKISPKEGNVILDDKFTAIYAEGEGDVYYETIKINESGEKTIQAEGEKEVESKAVGKIVIYNNYSKSSQKLIDNTRFEAPNGLIYRIKDAVRVPGQVLKDGKLMPGKLVVTVYADKTGSKYNIEDPVRFTIPGLKGTSLYDGFYASLKTEITGGDKGVRPVIEEKQKEEVVKNLKEELKETLISQISNQIPEDYIYYEGVEKIYFDVLPIKMTEDGKAKIVVSASLSAVLFSDSNFAKMIAERKIEGYEEEDVLLENPEKLSFSLLNKDSFNPDNQKSFDFNLKGEDILIWQIDKKELSKKLKGRPKFYLKDILSDFKGVKRAQASIAPFWRQKFPQDENNIDITIERD